MRHKLFGLRPYLQTFFLLYTERTLNILPVSDSPSQSQLLSLLPRWFSPRIVDARLDKGVDERPRVWRLCWLCNSWRDRTEHSRFWAFHKHWLEPKGFCFDCTLLHSCGFTLIQQGYAYSGLSGRVSHTLSLRGPCFTVDTACSATVRH